MEADGIKVTDNYTDPTHDECCRAHWKMNGTCSCDFIAEVRANEREKVAQRVAEAVSHKQKGLNTIDGYVWYLGRCECGERWPHIVDPVVAARGEDTSHA